MENLRSSNNKGGNRKWKFSKFAPILAGALFLINPSWANAQNVSNHTRTKAEVSTSNILDRLNQKIWITLPSEYNEKVLDFVLNDTIMRTKSATAYTEEFIINEMKKDRWICKQNQLLFIRSKIYEWIAQTKLYKLLDDTDINRRSEYKKSLKQIANCYEGYEKWFKTYMETKSADADRRSADADRRSADADRRSADADRRSADADRRSADADRRSADADRRSADAVKEIMKQDSTRVKERMTEFYDLCIQNPNNIKQSDLDFMKKSTKEFITDCKKRGINYRTILLKEVWDKKKVDAILKFYGVE